MKSHNVHIFAVVRVKVPNVEAENHEDAIRKAMDLVDFYSLFEAEHPQQEVEETEYAEEESRFLVEEAEDVHYVNSRWYEMSDGDIVPTRK